MAEDLNATRRLRGKPDGEAGPADGGRRAEDLAADIGRDLAGRDLAARSPQIDTAAGTPTGTLPPVRRWVSQAHSVPEIARELNKIWGSAVLRSGGDGENHVAARSSVLNLVVIAGHQEIAERCAATIAHMAGRHPSRSIILSARDAEGPPSLDAQVEAHCMLPASGTAETCAEMIYITTGGDTSRHLAAIIVPLLVHDLPVAVWWPHDPQFHTHRADRLLPLADKLIVDGAGWSGNGLDRLAEMAHAAATRGLVVADFALIRQSRWREALASVYDRPDLRPHLRAIRSITVEYASADKSDPGGQTNVVKPVYHVAWLASRLGMSVVEKLHRDGDGRRVALLRQGQHEVTVRLAPVRSQSPPGTTERVVIVSRRRGEELVGDVTAEQQTVDVTITEGGVERVRRSYLAPRQSEMESLAGAVEEAGPDPIAGDCLAMANCLITAEPMRRRRASRSRAARPPAPHGPEPSPEDAGAR